MGRLVAERFAVAAGARWIVRHLVIETPRWLWRVPPYDIGGIASHSSTKGQMVMTSSNKLRAGLGLR
jgi:hypothetical protein